MKNSHISLIVVSLRLHQRFLLQNDSYGNKTTSKGTLFILVTFIDIRIEDCKNILRHYQKSEKDIKRFCHQGFETLKCVVIYSYKENFDGILQLVINYFH